MIYVELLESVVYLLAGLLFGYVGLRLADRWERQRQERR